MKKTVHALRNNKNAVKDDCATANLIIRLTPDQKNKMVSIAQKEGKNLTQFVLSRCLC